MPSSKSKCHVDKQGEIPKHIICQMLKITFVTLKEIIANPNVHRVQKEIFHSFPRQI